MCNMATTTSRVYQFKITLKDSKPKIWRRIEVPEEYSFWDLHVAIQDAMGWKDYHLHQFIFKTGFGLTIFIGKPNEMDKFDHTETIPEETVKIPEYFSFPKKKAIYEYDFGDGWEHEVILEKILPATVGTRYPRCTAGKRACPPEDCGGTDGYEDLLEIISNPQHKEYEETMKWLGGSFNPENFDPKLIQFRNPEERWKTVYG